MMDADPTCPPQNPANATLTSTNIDTLGTTSYGWKNGQTHAWDGVL